LIIRNGVVAPFERVPIAAGPAAAFDERFVQDIVFAHPDSLPIAEIDRAYEGLIPVCKELYTAGGYIDVLYVTPTGRLVILEAKLWRNPEARRKVVAQILDYAKELSSWSYEDLNATAPRGSVFDDVNATAPRGSVFADINATAPRSSVFHDIQNSAPRSDGVNGDLEKTAP
jgi:hypothetical protein